MGQKKLTDTDYSKDWPKFLNEKKSRSKLFVDKPVVVDMSKTNSEKKLEDLVTKNEIMEIIDEYDEQLAELMVSRSPQLYKAPYLVKKESLKKKITDHYKNKPSWKSGSWVYFPWSKRLIHVLSKELFQEVRTIRNKNLITVEEQEKFANFNAGFTGMSVGSNAAIATIIQGGSQSVKLADSAVISASNLNRIITGVESVGITKSIVIARKLYEMNPYLEIDRFKENISPENISKFFEGDNPLNVVIDEIDDLEIKIALRVEARKRRIPVIMVTELGDDLMIDVERFDKNHNAPLFHGMIGNVENDIKGKKLTSREWLKYATSLINTKNVPVKMQKSLLDVGTKVVTHPQLGGTAMMVGGVVSYAVRKIALNEPLKSGRHVISLDKELLKDGKSLKRKIEHKRHTRTVKKSLGAM